MEWPISWNDIKEQIEKKRSADELLVTRETFEELVKIEALQDAEIDVTAEQAFVEGGVYGFTLNGITKIDVAKPLLIEDTYVVGYYIGDCVSDDGVISVEYGYAITLLLDNDSDGQMTYKYIFAVTDVDMITETFGLADPYADKDYITISKVVKNKQIDPALIPSYTDILARLDAIEAKLAEAT